MVIQAVLAASSVASNSFFNRSTSSSWSIPAPGSPRCAAAVDVGELVVGQGVGVDREREAGRVGDVLRDRLAAARLLG